jgi:hypothetical protein
MVTKDQIVIVTSMADPHADDVIRRLGEMGHEPVRLNTDDIPLNVSMSVSLGHGGDLDAWNGTIEILTNGRVINLEHVNAIWWRRPGPFCLPAELSEQEREFAGAEIDHTLSGLWAALECYWMSHPESVRRASWRTGQLQCAARLGFDVPRTLITTDPDAVRSFYAALGGQVVFKVMTDPFLGASKIAEKHPDQPPPELYMTHTTLMTESELALLDSVCSIPCMFQEYVPKKMELRVTVIGDEVFAAEIHSQAHEETQIDWHARYDIPYRKAELPAEIAERCLAFVRSYGLNFSALNLVLTPDERYVFMKNDPNGQFGFVEELVPELEMTAALVDCLIRGGNR